MRLAISGDYPADWNVISRRVRDAAGWRCVRCNHPFDPTTGRPLPCTEECDRTRGRNCVGGGLDAPDTGLRIEGAAKQPHMPDVPGLNYGVHHFDGRKDNVAWYNLMALCNSCHLRVQARVIPERPWLFSHSTWMIPYVCGFYAHFYGRAEITRGEAEAEPDRWLALGQPWLYEHQVAPIGLPAGGGA
jgi:hypothetical protein